MCIIEGSKEEAGAEEDDVNVLMMFNADVEPRLFHLPPTPHKGQWRLIIDTGLP